jgi:xanthine dehydrogenase YagR molybdenum-binding subunit
MSQDENGKASAEKLYVGTAMDRVDARLKVTGRAKYAGEFSAPKLAHGVLLQSTIARGKVKRIDSSEAEHLPGVLAVITHENLPKVSRPSVPPSGQSVPLLVDDILFSGQNIAVVIAETLEQAEYAAELLKVEYEPAKPSFDMEANLESAFIPGATGRQPVSHRGDSQSGLGQGAKSIDQIYRTPVEHHNPMEPHATVATWTDDQHVVAYDATQGVVNSSRAIAGQMELPTENVRIIDPFVGGGFGCKGQSWPHSAIAVMASKVVNRPVKIELTRRQMFTSNGHRPETRQALKIAADANAKLTGIEADMVNSTSRLDSFLEPTGGDSDMSYSCPNVSVKHRLVRLDEPAPTYMRAPGEASGSFSIETAMDELAASLKIDPIELRLRNYAGTDESKQRPFSSKSLKECYAQGAQAFGWDKRNPEIGSMKSGGMLVGYGMATATYPANFRQSSAKAIIGEDGQVTIQCATQDLGTGTYTILTQIACDALGVDPHQVHVHIGDTKLPPGPQSGGSQTAATAGSAVQNAAQTLRQTLVQLATSRTDTPLHNLAPTELIVSHGVVRSKADPSKSMSYPSILKIYGKKTVEESGSAGPGLERGPQGGQSLPTAPKGYTMQGFGAQFCEIHIDPDLRMLRVARWVGAFALGTTLNRKTLSSQLYGGIVFGIGMALLEETMRDQNYARFVNSNLAEYHVPVHKDIPDMQVIIVPEKDTLVNPLGVKGGGEIGITGVCAAIGNAIYHATGKRVREVPITLDKIL